MSGLKDTALWQVGRDAKRQAGALAFAGISRAILARPFRLIVVAGLKRSGNHVFLNWMLSQSLGPCAFWNHVAPDQYPTERHRREYRLNAVNQVPTVVLSYEDRDLTAVATGALARFLEDHAPRIRRRDLVLVLREPKNLMASRFKKWPGEYESADEADALMTLWHAYAAAALDGAPPAGWEGWQPHAVWFDALVNDASARDRLSDALDLRRGARGLDQVTNHGHGSSFDGLAGAGDPSAMQVSERWRAFSGDPAFERLFADGRAEEVAQRLAAQAVSTT